MAIRPLNSVAGFSVGETPSNIILANGDITTTNITTTGVSNLNSVGNIKISGGSAGQVISTDGSGNLSFITVGTASLNNGTSNVTVLSSGNITFSVAGNANVGIFTSTGLNVDGYVTVSGNITGGNANLGNAATANFFIGAGNNLSNIQGANVSGAVAFATTANAVAGANVSGEVSFAATANAVAGANVSGAVAFATTANAVAGANVSGTVANANNAAYAGNVTIAGQANITSLGTLTSLNVNATVNATSFASNVATGTAPLTVLSNTVVANLNADLLDGFNTATANTASTVAVRDASGNLAANFFIGNGSQLTGLNTDRISNGNSNVAIPSADGNVNITAVGNTTLVITGTGANISGTLNATGNANVGNIGATRGVFTNIAGEGGNISNIQGANVSGAVSTATTAGTVTTNAQPNITSVGTLSNLSVTGNVTAANFFGALANGNSNVSIPSANGNVNITSAGNATVVITGTGANIAGTLNATGNANVGNLGTVGLITATGNVTGGNLNTSGNVNASIMVDGGTGIYLAAGPAGYINFFTTGGDKASISDTGNITGSNVIANSTVFAAAANVSGNVTAGNVYANSGTIGASLLTGTLTTAAQPNITSVGTLANLNVTGNITTSANVTTDFVVSKTGTITIAAIGTDQDIELKPTGNGTVDVWGKIISNVATPNAATDAATKQYVDDVAQGLHTHDSCGAATPDTLANVTGGTITYNNGTAGVGANLVTTGSFNLIDGVNVQTSGTRILVKSEANLAHNGIYTWANASTIVRATDFDTPTEMAGGDFTFVTAGTLYDNTGWVMTEPVTTVGTSPVPWVQFSGAGTYTSGTGLTLTGSQFSISNTTVTASSYGSGDAVATFTVNAQGQLTAAANVAITANAANLTGTTLNSSIVTSSLTSVGTLGALAVTANVTAGNVYANTGTIGAGTLKGEGGNISNIQGANVSGAVSFATTANAVAGANVSGQVGNALVAGTVYTNDQPNITSVGTLSALSVTGNVSTGNISGTNGNLTTANISGNIILGNATVTTQITWSSLTTTSTAANQTIASISTTGITGVEYLIKATDATGSKYSVASVIAVTDGTSVDYSTYGTVQLGGYTGSLAVNIVGGQLRLQVTPASSNSTVWTTQYRLI